MLKMKCPRLLKLFRNRFQTPHFKFVEMCNDLSQEGAFLQWTSVDAVGESRAELSLLLLGALKYLGRSWTFDCLEEANGLSRETNRLLFNSFIEYSDNKLYKRYVLVLHQKLIFLLMEKYMLVLGSTVVLVPQMDHMSQC